MTSTFLPSDYEVPSTKGNYMKFQEGENRFRILCSPVMGWVSWEESKDGTKKPLRRIMNEPFNLNEVEYPEKIKHFWAMIVWNYIEEKIQILEIRQKGIQKSIKALAADEDWGSPLNYDLVITREGKELDTTYTVNPKPAKPLDKKIAKLYQETYCKLPALFYGEDPFTDSDLDRKQKDL